LHSTSWIDFLAGFGSIVLTFLAGAEVDPDLMREKLKESLWIGGISFLAPFVIAWLAARYVFGWDWKAAQICGVALSTTSLAVVYAVLVETGLTHTTLGKIIMAATFVTDFGTALALSLLFIHPTWWLIPFLLVSAGIIIGMPRLQPWFFPRYGDRVIEPEIKGAFAALLVMMYFADRAQSHAVLPAFILGLAVAKILHAHREEQRRFRVVTFALLTPFFFIKSGMNVSLKAVGAQPLQVQELRVRLNRALLGKAVAVSAATIALFFAGWPVAKVAVVAGAWLLMTRRVKPEKVYHEIDWALLSLFAGLFVVVAGVEKTSLEEDLLQVASHFRLGNVWVLSGFSALLSNLVSNVPAVLVFRPLVDHLPDPRRGWLTLAMSSTLAGNLTILGSVANLIVVHRARHKARITFWEYLRVGVPLTLLTLAVGAAWLQWRS
jgi:Kef-type K+ transport system membrane component KefB